MQGQRTGLVNLSRNISGTGAAAIKYDILTALLVTATRGDPVEARLSVRLSLLITARFNWRTGLFAVGQHEIARMWGVTVRTAKRDMSQMRAREWITVAAPAARGRVAQYRINLPVVMRATMPHWDAVGPDFAARMSAGPDHDVEEGSNVVPLRPAPEPVTDENGTGWAQAARRLQAQDPATFAAWLAPLRAVDLESGVLTLLAPNQFMAIYIQTHYQTRILAAIVAHDRSVRDVHILAKDA